jgi:hypothetical protein
MVGFELLAGVEMQRWFGEGEEWLVGLGLMGAAEVVIG